MKIDCKIKNYFEIGKVLKLGKVSRQDHYRDQIKIKDNKIFYFLHSNLIVVKDRLINQTFFTLANWNSRTTRSRLSALLPYNVSSKQFMPYYNGKQIDPIAWYDHNGNRLIHANFFDVSLGDL